LRADSKKKIVNFLIHDLDSSTGEHMGIWSEFSNFLKEYKVVGLAVAFIMGAAVNDLVKSLVNNIIMPFINPLLPAGDWQTSTVVVGPFDFGLGAFLSSLIYFIIIAFVVFMIAKKVLGEEKVTKK
jgi:large conductance mechanosensitive channel